MQAIDPERQRTPATVLQLQPQPCGRRWQARWGGWPIATGAAQDWGSPRRVYVLLSASCVPFGRFPHCCPSVASIPPNARAYSIPGARVLCHPHQASDQQHHPRQPGQGPPLPPHRLREGGEVRQVLLLALLLGGLALPEGL